MIIKVPVRRIMMGDLRRTAGCVNIKIQQTRLGRWFVSDRSYSLLLGWANS